MTTELTEAADLQPGDTIATGGGTTQTVTRTEALGPHAVIVHTDRGEYGTFANRAVFEMAEAAGAPRPTEDHPDHGRIKASEPKFRASRPRALHARPTAGAPASNQYGVFQVAYASEKQTAFIRSLMDRKDLSAADPKKVDVAALAEQVAAGQVNKKAASAIIDILLALPEATLETVLRPATDKQKTFLRTLLSEREGHPDAEAVRASLNEAREAGRLTSPLASESIALLMEIPKNQADVPAGRYALPAPDRHFVFYKVDRPTEGRWAGRVFVKQLVGSVGRWDENHLPRSVESSVLKRIAADPEEAARMFGIKAQACGMCASPLSNARSRAAGYGETCAAKHGFFYPTEAQALEILHERDEA